MEFKKILSLIEKNNLLEAKKEILNELSHNSNDSNLYNLLGIIDAKEGNINSAIKNFRFSTTINPDNCNASQNLAIYLSKLNLDNPEIDYFFKKSIELEDLEKNPNYINFLINYGVYLNKINSNDSKKYFELAIKHDPNNTNAYIGLSNYYFEKNNFDECIKICNEAIDIKRISHEGLYYNIGISYLRKNLLNDSLKAFKKALNYNQFNSETHNNLGLIHYFLQNDEQSLFHFNLALSINSKSWKVLENLGTLFFRKRDYVNALKNYKKSYFLNRDNTSILDKIAKYYVKFNKRKFANYYFEKVLRQKKTDAEFLSNYLYHYTFNENVDYNVYLNQAKKINFLKKNYIKFSNEGYKKNKIGFVSADFRNHPVGYSVKDTLKYLSKSFEVYCYSNNRENDNLTNEIKKNVHHWNNIYSLDSEEVRSQIIKNKIDILFDLGGHTAHNRLDIFATRSSPIQITWCGWLASSGLDNMDYTIIDKNIFTKDLSKFFSEKFIIMNLIWSSYSLHNICFEKELSQISPCIKNGYITFGAFHNLNKINDSVVTVWSEILKDTPNKIYFISNDFRNKIFLKKFIKRFTSRGIKEHQLIFSNAMPREIFFQEYKKIDILLDTFPYGGGTTSFDTIGMNVPILTLEGKYFLTRLAYSININLKMEDLIAKSIDEYIQIAKSLTFQDIVKFKNLLISIDKKKCKLFDTESFTEELSDKLKQLM